MIWSSFLLIVLSINVLYVPVAISFVDIILSPFAEALLNIIPNFCFIIEILVKFNTVFCFFVGSYLENAYLQTALLLRYFDIVRLIGELEERYNLRDRFYGIVDLIKLILFILFIAHLCGCVWHYIAVVEIQAGYSLTWLGKTSHPVKYDWKANYVDSLYWSVVTMCTLGYGDILPVTSSEKLFTIGVTLISCFVFGYSVNQIGDILKEFLRIEEEYKVKMAKLNMYMKKRELNDDVTVKVRKYFEYLHKEKLQSNVEGATLIDSLENDLKSEVLKDIYGKLLRSKKLFQLNFDIESLSVKIKERTIGLNEYIYKEGDGADCIFFLLKGQMEVIKTQTNTVLQRIEKGMMFGEIEFFTGQNRQFTIRSNSVSQLAYLHKEDFIKILNDRKTDFEKFKKMQDQLFVYQDTQGLDHQCGSCGKYTHLLIHCPQINVVLNKQKILSAYNFQYSQERKKDFKRLGSRYICWLSKIRLVQQLAQTFIKNEKITQFQDQQSNNFDEDEEDLFLENNSGQKLQNNGNIISYGNDEKRQSMTQFNDINIRKKSQLLFPYQMNNQTNFNDSQQRDLHGSPKASYNQRKSRFSIQQVRSRNISRAEGDNKNKTIQYNIQNQNEKYCINILNQSHLSNQSGEKQIQQNKQKEKDNIFSLFEGEEDITYQSALNNKIPISDLLSKSKKRGLMPSYFDSKKGDGLTQSQLGNKVIDKTYNEVFQISNDNPELNEKPRLRNKSSITISSQSDSDQDESVSSSIKEKRNIKSYNKNEINKINGQNEIIDDNSNEKLSNLNQEDIINKLLNSCGLEEEKNNDKQSLEKDQKSDKDFQKAINLLGLKSSNSQYSMTDELFEQQKVLQLMTGQSNLQIEQDGQNLQSIEKIPSQQEYQQKYQSQQISQNPQSLLSIQEYRKSILEQQRKSIQENRNSLLLPIEEAQQLASNRSSQTSLSGNNPKKKSILCPPSPKITTPNHLAPNSMQNQMFNQFQKILPNQIGLGGQLNQTSQSHTQINNLISKQSNKSFQNIASPSSGSSQKNLISRFPTSNNQISDVRRKVSILVTNKANQEVPYNVTVSVSKKEQDQLREIFELESKLMYGNSFLKKTLPRRLSYGIRSNFNDNSGKNEENYINYQQHDDQRLEEVDNEDDEYDNDDRIKQNDQQKHYFNNIPSLINLEMSNYQLKLDNQYSQNQINQDSSDYNKKDFYPDLMDQLEIRKYQQILLKRYDDVFISQFEKLKEYTDYFPRNNFSNVLELISIRRKLNPFYRELLLRKRAQNKQRPVVSRLYNYKKGGGGGVGGGGASKNLKLKTLYGSSFLKQSFSVNTQKQNCPSDITQ